MTKPIGLHELDVGACATVKSLHNEDRMRRRLRDLGIVDGTKIECIGKSPCGDPHAYFVRKTVVAIRECDAKKITVVPLFTECEENEDN